MTRRHHAACGPRRSVAAGDRDLQKSGGMRRHYQRGEGEHRTTAATQMTLFTKEAAA